MKRDDDAEVERLARRHLPAKRYGFLVQMAEHGDELARETLVWLRALRRCRADGSLDVRSATQFFVQAIPAVEVELKKTTDRRGPQSGSEPVAPPPSKLPSAKRRAPASRTQQAHRNPRAGAPRPTDELFRRHLPLVEAVGRNCALRLRRDLEEGKACAGLILAGLLGRNATVEPKQVVAVVKKRLMGRRSPLLGAPERTAGGGGAGCRGAASKGRRRDDRSPATDVVVRRLRDQADARERVERATGIKLGSFDEGQQLPECPVRRRDGRWVWPSRPGCDERVVQAVAPFLNWRARRPELSDLAQLVELGVHVDSAGTDRPKEGDLGARLHMLANEAYWRQQAQIATGCKGPHRRIPWEAADRRARRKLLDDVAVAIEAVAMDPATRGRLLGRHGAEFLALLRWASRLRTEAATLAREPGGRPSTTTEFDKMVRRLRDIGDRRGRPLPPLVVGYSIFALDVDERDLPRILDAVADSFKKIRSSSRSSPPST